MATRDEYELNETQCQWLKAFMVIYKQASPLIDTIAKLPTEGQPLDRRSLIEAYRSFGPLLKSLKGMPKPTHKELRNIKNDFKKTLSMCIKAGEMAVKMVDDLGHGYKLASRMHLSSIVGYMGYAGIYHKALLDRLAKNGF
ncbi:MAG: hypothetical protein AABZ77_07060 [Chloroflexota bacterium]